MITKTKRIDLKASESDEKNLKRAAENMKFETGKTPNVSNVIMHSVREYASKEPYYFNALLFNAICQLHVSCLKHYQNIANDFLMLKFGNITLNDFARIEANDFSDIQKRFYNEIEGDILKLQLTNELLKNNLRSGTEEPFLQFKTKVLVSLDLIDFSKKHGPPLPLSIQNYTLKNGLVTFTDSDREKIKLNHCTTLLDTESRRHFAKLAEQTFENLKELKAILVKDNSSKLFGRRACFDEDDEQVFYDRETLKFIK
jgi:hypothetical protein